MSPNCIAEPPKTDNDPLELSLGFLESLYNAGLVIVERDPSPEMAEAGVLAGAPSKEVAIAIYKAMISALD